MRQIVIFKIGNENYCLDINQVNEIINIPQITKIPEMPKNVEGLIDLRGKVFAVVNFHKELGLSSFEFNKRTKLVILNHATANIGIIVDRITQIVKIEDSCIDQSKETVSGLSHKSAIATVSLQNSVMYWLDIQQLIVLVEDKSLVI